MPHCMFHIRRRIAAFTAILLLIFTGIRFPIDRVAAQEAPQEATGVRIYVDFDAAGSNNGTTWTHAYTKLQDAIARAKGGDVIWVAKGVYYPDEVGGTNTNSQAATFQLKSGVAIYGGFVGNETNLNQRKVIPTTTTVLSGDVDHDVAGGADTTDANGVVTAYYNMQGNNAYHVVTAGGVNTQARLDGFTITAGKATANDTFCSLNACGGGLYSDTGSPTLANLTFQGNRAHYGAGMFANGASSIALTDVTFAWNHADGNGGGLQAQDNVNVELTRVTFDTNAAFGSGAGFYLSLTTAAIADSTFKGNSAIENGGGFYIYQSTVNASDTDFADNHADLGGGVFADEAYSPAFMGGEFSGNEAGAGAGFYDYYSDAQFTGVTFSNNDASGNGGGLYIEAGSTRLIDVQFNNNRAGDNGGGILSFGGNPTLNHVTFDGNWATSYLDSSFNRAGGLGGGIYNFVSNASVRGAPILTDVTFRRNRAEFAGGGMYNETSSPALTNVSFLGNIAVGYESDIAPVIIGGNGGAMVNTDDSEPTLTNVVMAGNAATNYAGAMMNDTSNPILTNVTLTGNKAGDGAGGIFNHANSFPLLQNTIVWGNSAVADPNLYNEPGATPTIRYSIVEGGLAGSADGGNNLTSDPRFVRGVDCKAGSCGDGDDDYGDLRLRRDSPAVDVGDNAADLDGGGAGSAIISSVAVDRGGKPRISAAVKLPAQIDLGAYERVNSAAAVAGGPYSGNEGSAVALDGSASHDDGSLVSYAWDCTNDGSADATAAVPTGNSCTYPNDGEYVLRLTTTDNLGATGTNTTPVVIENVAPVLTDPANQNVSAGTAKAFKLGNLADPGAEGAWPVTVDWGDDTPADPFNVAATGAIFRTHTFAAAGQYDVVVTISDGDAQDDAVFQVTVVAGGAAPVVSAAGNQSATAGTAKNFNLGSFSDGGDAGPWQVTVDWGDDSADTQFNATAAGALPKRAHRFAGVGQYDVTVSVSDGELSTDATFKVTVKPGGGAEGVVQGAIFNDANGNGKQDPGEAGIPGVEVTLKDQAGAAGAATVDPAFDLTTVTGSDGSYRFENVPAGDYTLTVQPPPGYTLVGPREQSVTVGSGGPTTVPPIDVEPGGDQLYLPTLQK